jgi:hypothetical protein
MTFCVQRYINLHEFGHLLLIFLEPIERNGHIGTQFSLFPVVVDTLPESCVKDKTRGKSENYP